MLVTLRFFQIHPFFGDLAKKNALRYLQVVRRLIQTYTLEPAGSHGVWGLDDHSFLPYIFGSAQLTRPISEAEPMPLEGSVRGAPKTGDVAKREVIVREREKNMYFSAIGFINDVKTGPFWEHSPILYDVSGVQDGWGKINKARPVPLCHPPSLAFSISGHNEAWRCNKRQVNYPSSLTN